MLANVAIALVMLMQAMVGAGSGKRIIVGILLAKNATKSRSQNARKSATVNNLKGASSSLFFLHITLRCGTYRTCKF
jgi:hypothetical protein